MLNNKNQFILKLNDLESIFICNSNDASPLITFTKNGKKFFFKVPSSISFIKKNDCVIFYIKTEKNYSTFITFKNLLDNLLSNKSNFKKKLELNGLGFKVNAFKDNVDLKLGYSHPLSLITPKVINKISVKKKKITIESLDKIKLGNFAYKMYSLRKYDVYKGKGFSMINQKKRLKAIKKK